MAERTPRAVYGTRPPKGRGWGRKADPRPDPMPQGRVGMGGTMRWYGTSRGPSCGGRGRDFVLGSVF